MVPPWNTPPFFVKLLEIAVYSYYFGGSLCDKVFYIYIYVYIYISLSLSLSLSLRHISVETSIFIGAPGYFNHKKNNY